MVNLLKELKRKDINFGRLFNRCKKMSNELDICENSDHIIEFEIIVQTLTEQFNDLNELYKVMLSNKEISNTDINSIIDDSTITSYSEKINSMNDICNEFRNRHIQRETRKELGLQNIFNVNNRGNDKNDMLNKRMNKNNSLTVFSNNPDTLVNETIDITSYSDNYFKVKNNTKNTDISSSSSSSPSNEIGNKDDFLDERNIVIKREMKRKKLRGKDNSIKDSALEEIIKKHRELQDDIIKDILIMSTHLKENSQKSLNVIVEDNKLLSKFNIEVDKNISSLEKEHTKLKTQNQKSSACTVSLFFILLLILSSFFVIYYFLRITPKF